MIAPGAAHDLFSRFRSASQAPLPANQNNIKLPKLHVPERDASLDEVLAPGYGTLEVKQTVPFSPNPHLQSRALPNLSNESDSLGLPWWSRGQPPPPQPPPPQSVRQMQPLKPTFSVVPHASHRTPRTLTPLEQAPLPGGIHGVPDVLQLRSQIGHIAAEAKKLSPRHNENSDVQQATAVRSLNELRKQQAELYEFVRAELEASASAASKGMNSPSMCDVELPLTPKEAPQTPRTSRTATPIQGGSIRRSANFGAHSGGSIRRSANFGAHSRTATPVKLVPDKMPSISNGNATVCEKRKVQQQEEVQQADAAATFRETTQPDQHDGSLQEQEASRVLQRPDWVDDVRIESSVEVPPRQGDGQIRTNVSWRANFRSSLSSSASNRVEVTGHSKWQPQQKQQHPQHVPEQETSQDPVRLLKEELISAVAAQDSQRIRRAVVESLNSGMDKSLVDATVTAVSQRSTFAASENITSPGVLAEKPKEESSCTRTSDAQAPGAHGDSQVDVVISEPVQVLSRDEHQRDISASALASTVEDSEAVTDDKRVTPVSPVTESSTKVTSNADTVMRVPETPNVSTDGQSLVGTPVGDECIVQDVACPVRPSSVAKVYEEIGAQVLEEAVAQLQIALPANPISPRDAKKSFKELVALGRQHPESFDEISAFGKKLRECPSSCAVVQPEQLTAIEGTKDSVVPPIIEQKGARLEVNPQQEAQEAFEKLRVAGAELRSIQAVPVSKEDALKSFEELCILGAQVRAAEKSGQIVKQVECDEGEIMFREPVQHSSIQNLKPLPEAMEVPTFKAEPLNIHEPARVEEFRSASRMADLADLAVVEVPYYLSQVPHDQSPQHESVLHPRLNRSGVVGMSTWMQYHVMQKEIEERKERVAEEQARLEERAKWQKEACAIQNIAKDEYVMPEWLKNSLMLSSDSSTNDETKDKEQNAAPASPSGTISKAEQAHLSETSPLQQKRGMDPAEIMVNAVSTAMQAGCGSAVPLASAAPNARKGPTPYNLPSHYKAPESTLNLSSHNRHLDSRGGSSRRKRRSDRDPTERARRSASPPSMSRKQKSIELPSKHTPGSPSQSEKASWPEQDAKEDSIEAKTAKVQREMSKAIFHNDMDRLESIVLEALDAGIPLPRSDILMVENMLEKERIAALTGQPLQ